MGPVLLEVEGFKAVDDRNVPAVTEVSFAVREGGIFGIEGSILAGNNPLGVVPAALLFGAFKSGALTIDLSFGVPSELVKILRGLIILFGVDRAFPDVGRAIRLWIEPDHDRRGESRMKVLVLDRRQRIGMAIVVFKFLTLALVVEGGWQLISDVTGVVGTPYFASALGLAVPIAFAGMGGIFAEKPSVLNIGLEELLIIGAFSAIASRYALTATPLGANLWASYLIAILASGFVAWLFAVVCIEYKNAQFIDGLAVWLIALGVAPSEASSSRTGRTARASVRFQRSRSPSFLNFRSSPRYSWPRRPSFCCSLPSHSRGISSTERRSVCGPSLPARTRSHLIPPGSTSIESGTPGSSSPAMLWHRGYRPRAQHGPVRRKRRYDDDGRGWIGLTTYLIGNYNPLGAALASFLVAGLVALQIQFQQITDACRHHPAVAVLVVLTIGGRSRLSSAAGDHYETNE